MSQDQDEQKINQLVMTIQMLEQRLGGLTQNLEMIEATKQSLVSSNETILNLSKSEIGKPLLVPIGSMVMIPMMVEQLDKVIVNVGASIYMEKSINDATKLIEKRIEKIIESENYLTNQMNQMAQQLNQYKAQLQRYVGDRSKG